MVRFRTNQAIHVPELMRTHHGRSPVFGAECFNQVRHRLVDGADRGMNAQATMAP
jgi:hypothetical protein